MRSLKCGVFIDYLSDFQILKNDSAACVYCLQFLGFILTFRVHGCIYITLFFVLLIVPYIWAPSGPFQSRISSKNVCSSVLAFTYGYEILEVNEAHIRILEKQK